MNILVTGGNGLAGSALKELYNNNDVLIKNNKYYFVSRKEYDLLKINEIYECFEKYKPDVIVHLAGVLKKGSTSDSNTQLELLLDNSRINLNIFDACEKFNIKKIITCLSVTLSSTEKDIDEISIDNGPELFLNFHQGYNHSKRLLHCLSTIYKQSNKGDVILLTPPNIYGYQDVFTSSRLIPALINKCNNNEIINLSKNCVRQMIYNKDLARIIMSFINLNNEIFKQNANKPILIGNKTLLKTSDIIKEICIHLKKDYKSIQYNENNNFSRTINMTNLPFDFTYTNLDVSFKEIFNNLRFT